MPSGEAPSAALLPQSDALAEASAGSLSELMDRDPAGYSGAERARIIAWLREQRARWQKTEAENTAKPKRGTAAAKELRLTASASPEDLGL